MLSILIVTFEIPKKVQHAFSILDATALKCSALHLIGHLRRSRQFAENWHLKKPTKKRRMALGSPLDLRDPRRTWGSLPAFLPIVGISHN